jgi:hypothetical protein
MRILIPLRRIFEEIWKGTCAGALVTNNISMRSKL